MRLIDFELDLEGSGPGAEARTQDQNLRYNRTSVPRPPHEGVGRRFRRQVVRDPLAPAVIADDVVLSYSELDLESDRIAGFLQAHGIAREHCVGVLLERSPHLVAALLGTLKAGAAYLPLATTGSPRQLAERIDRTACRVVIGERAHLRLLNDLQWLCPSLEIVLCIDAEDFFLEREPAGARMNVELWDHTARNAGSAIEASGWRQGAAGAVLPEAEMGAYVDAMVERLGPWLHPGIRVLEIGCGTGLVMRALAPRVGRYVGIDLSSEALAWARDSAQAQAWGERVSLHCLSAEQLDELDEGPFDVVILASVIQSFPGLNYLRAVIAACVDRLADGAVLLAGHVWDPERRSEFERIAGADERDPALFVHRAFWDDLAAVNPRICSLQLSGLALPEWCSLHRYSYDVVMRVGAGDDTVRRPSRIQADRAALARLRDRSGEFDGEAAEALAYVIFTSGSTGRPKGVQIEVGALLNLLDWYIDFCAIEPGTRVLQVIPSTFDASVKNYLAPLLAGATVVLLSPGPYDPQRLLAVIEEHEVHVLNPGVPSMIYPVLDLAEARGYEPLQQLRILALGGEAPDLGRLRRWLEHPSRRTRVANLYGPTECTDIALAEPDIGLCVGAPPIGRPIPNLRAYVLDEAGRPLPPGVVGELHIAGLGVARGYAAAPGEQIGRFLPDPFVDGERMYRTGDLVVRREDGAIVYVGRADHQIKIRGVRIEPEEVEARLRSLDGIRDAAVTAYPRAGGEIGLCAFLVTEGDRDPVPETMRTRLAADLPEQAIPDRFERIDRLPTGAHGKLDRSRLQPMTGRRLDAVAVSSPTTELQRRLFDLWRQVLGHDGFGVDDDFFAAGGHSLKTVLLADAIAARLGAGLTIADLYQSPTIATQAAAIERIAGRPAARPGRGPQVLNQTGRPALFCLPPISAVAWSFIGLAEQLKDFTVHAFDFEPGEDRLQRMLSAMCAAQPQERPFLLLGYSAGGGLALEVAAALESAGRRVGRLVLIDSVYRPRPPGYPPDEIEATVRFYLDDPRFSAMAAEDAVRAAWAERIRAYCRHHGSGADRHVIDAPISLIRAGRLGADPAGWSAATRTGFDCVEGVGEHERMLSAPFVKDNTRLIAAALRGEKYDD